MSGDKDVISVELSVIIKKFASHWSHNPDRSAAVTTEAVPHCLLLFTKYERSLERQNYLLFKIIWRLST